MASQPAQRRAARNSSTERWLTVAHSHNRQHRPTPDAACTRTLILLALNVVPLPRLAVGGLHEQAAHLLDVAPKAHKHLLPAVGQANGERLRKAVRDVLRP